MASVLNTECKVPIQMEKQKGIKELCQGVRLGEDRKFYFCRVEYESKWTLLANSVVSCAQWPPFLPNLNTQLQQSSECLR